MYISKHIQTLNSRKKLLETPLPQRNVIPDTRLDYTCCINESRIEIQKPAGTNFSQRYSTFCFSYKKLKLKPNRALFTAENVDKLNIQERLTYTYLRITWINPIHIFPLQAPARLFSLDTVQPMFYCKLSSSERFHQSHASTIFVFFSFSHENYRHVNVTFWSHGLLHTKYSLANGVSTSEEQVFFKKVNINSYRRKWQKNMVSLKFNIFSYLLPKKKTTKQSPV